MKRSRLALNKLIAYSIFSILCLYIFDIGYSQQSTIFQGTTVIEQVYSPGLEGNLLKDPSTQKVMIYLPPGYDDYPNNEYPVIYLLHGHSQGFNSFYSYGMFSLLNNMISDKTIVPMIVVTPNGRNLYTGCMYTNSYVSGNWEDYIVQDVVQYIESKYQVLDQRLSRGLGGFSSGGYGTMKIAMKHPAIYSSIVTIGTSVLSFEEKFLLSPGKESIIDAAKIEEWAGGLPQSIKNRWSNAVAFAPDSTALPVLGRFPFNADSLFIDSTWQKWLMHDPFTMLQTHADSLKKMNAIQMYVGTNDFVLPQNEIFHQALIDYGIDHGYEIYPGAHNPEPVIDSLLIFFSENLIGVVPNVRSLSKDSLYKSETLVVVSDMDGSLYIVPDTVHPSIDSIYKYQVMAIDVLAEEEKEILLSGFDFGKYLVYVVTNDNAVSNIPECFSLLDPTFISYPENDRSNLPEIAIFPNPSKEAVTILVGTQNPFEIVITNLNGQQVYSRRLQESSHQIDLSYLQKGVYLITIRSQDFLTTRKIIKM